MSTNAYRRSWGPQRHRSRPHERRMTGTDEACDACAAVARVPTRARWIMHDVVARLTFSFPLFLSKTPSKTR